MFEIELAKTASYTLRLLHVTHVFVCFVVLILVPVYIVHLFVECLMADLHVVKGSTFVK